MWWVPTAIAIVSACAFLGYKKHSRQYLYGKSDQVCPPLRGREPTPNAGGGLGSPEVWLTDRRLLDSKRFGFETEPWLHCIHNKLYDLRPFFDKHPGGRVYLELTQVSLPCSVYGVVVCA